MTVELECCDRENGTHEWFCAVGQYDREKRASAIEAAAREHLTAIEACRAVLSTAEAALRTALETA